MAYKQKNTLFEALKEGDKAEGYLIGIGVQNFPPKRGSTESSQAPTVTLQRKKDGKPCKYLLGSTVFEDVQRLTIGAMTLVVKGKSRKTTGGNNVIEYELHQDDSDLLTSTPA